jgi:hypothetical protein
MTESPFNWRVKPGPKKPEHAEKYPQSAYYWRKKAGLTGSRQNPQRHWRKNEL